IAASEFDDQLALGTTSDIGAGYRRGSKELPERSGQQAIHAGRPRIALSCLTLRFVFRPRPKVHRTPFRAAVPVGPGPHYERSSGRTPAKLPDLLPISVADPPSSERL